MNKNPNSYKYLPISQGERDWGLWVTGSGVASIQKAEIYPPPGHPSAYQMPWELGRRLQEFQILYIIKGQGRFESEFIHETEVKAGSVIFLFPNIWHRYQPDKQTGWEEYWVGCNGETLERFVKKNIISSQNPLLTIGYQEDVLKNFLNIHFYLKEAMVGFHQLAAAETYSLLTKILIAEKKQSIGGSHIEEKIKQAKILIMESCESNLNTKNIAENIGMSYEHFRRSFKAIIGMAPYQYHLEYKINRAKELLLMTNLSIKMVSDKLEFENQYYFSRIFKSKTGLAPTEWKQKQANIFQQKESL